MYKKDVCEIRMNMLGMSSEVLLVQLQVCEGAEGSQHPEQSLSCLVWVPAGPWGAAALPLAWLAAEGMARAVLLLQTLLITALGSSPAAGGRHFTGTILKIIMLL